MKLEGKTALITGGARGIGRAIALRLAGDGAKVAIMDVLPEVMKETQKDFAEKGIELLCYQADVTSTENVAQAMDSAVKDLGKLDILVNNAGITRDNLLIRLKETDWDLVLAVNLKGTFNCTRAACRPMMKARSGRIINIASVVGVMGNAGQSNYAASKAGVIGLTKSTAKELAARNITVNAVAPGFIATEMTDRLTDQQKELFLTNIPLKRAGTVEDVAGIVSFLASNDAAYVTGQVIHVDGGMVM